MKKLYFLLFAFLFTVASFAQTTVFINEIHYDNESTDADEGVEIAGPAGTDLGTYTISAYNGSNSLVYDTLALSGTIPDEGGSGFGTIWFAIAGLQNGAPDGLALDNNGTLIQFLSYEGEITAADGPANGVTSTDIGVAETSTTPVGESLQLIGSGDTYEEFTWATTMASTHDLINTGQTFTTDNTATLTITAPTNGALFNPGTSNVTLSINVQNFNVASGGTGDGYIVWSIDSGGGDVPQPDKFDTNDEMIPVTDGGSYFIIMELYNNADNPTGTMATVFFDVLTATQVPNLAALRTDVGMNGVGGFYEVMSVPTVTYTRDANRNQKYIQDATAGILIDDNDGIITTSFSIGDGISGLIGQATEFNNVLQFVPSADASVAAGSTVTPEVVTIATLLSNWEDYESELVQINSATFADAGMTFVSGTSYDISDGSTMTFRASFSEADYIGATIPAGANNMAVLVAEYQGTPQVTARSLSELTLSTTDTRIGSFELYPNPVSNGIVTINSTGNSPLNVKVFDILGKQVKNETIIGSTLNVSGLRSGIYLLNITQEGHSVTKKLVIE